MRNGQSLSADISTKRLLRPTIAITFFAVIGYAITFVTQMIIAAIFGAGLHMDAFFAAITIPQYIIAVAVGLLSPVLVPTFVHYATVGQDEEAWKVASGVITISFIILSVVALAGMAFSAELVRMTAPGLSEGSIRLASKVALVTWPIVVANGLVTILTGLYRAYGRFSWSSATSVISALVTLVFVIALARPLGVVGIAIATTAGCFIQALIMFPLLAGPGRYRFSIDWHHPGIRQVFHVFWPVALTNIATKWIPIIERYLASKFPEGAIACLGYSSKLTTVIWTLIAAGVANAVFPRMSLNVAQKDTAGLRNTMSLGLRTVWLITAPVIIIGIALSTPMIQAMFQRGAFKAADTLEISGLFRIYLLSLAGLCLGGITLRVFYAMKTTRLISAVGIIETVAYAIYTPLLAYRFGITGIAFGYVIYFNITVVWHALYLRAKLGGFGGRTVLMSFARISMAAICGGIAAWIVTLVVSNSIIALLSGGFLALTVYCGILLLLDAPEIMAIKDIVIKNIKIAIAAMTGMWNRNDDI